MGNKRDLGKVIQSSGVLKANAEVERNGSPSSLGMGVSTLSIGAVCSLLLAFAIVLLLLSMTWLVTCIQAQTGPEIEVRVPEPRYVLEDDGAITATLVVTCENIYGYQLVVTFDPQLLQADGAGFDDSFIKPDYTPPLWSATINNEAGTVRFAASQIRPALPVTGTGVIGWVRFVGQSAPMLPATATVGIHQPLLATRDGDPIVPTVISGTIRILPKAVITGQVQLQGRTDWSGAVAMAVQAGVTCTTDVSGWYTLTMAADIYTVTIEMSRYLDAERVVTATRGTNALSRVKLLAGDVNDDDVVDIVDLGIIGGKYMFFVDPLTERADVNADGIVDIIDIGLAGGNYMAESPVPWEG